MVHEVIEVVHRSVEAGGIVLVGLGAALGFYVATPSCTPARVGFDAKPPVCSNKIGVHMTGAAIGDPRTNGFYLKPDDHEVGWALGGIAAGAAVGGGLGYLWRELRGKAE